MTDMQKQVYKAIGKRPRGFSEIQRRCVISFYQSFRVVNRALQALRRQGKIRYLKKAGGGPGWVRT